MMMRSTSKPRETVIKSLLRLFPRNVSQEDNELRQQLITNLSEQQQDVTKLPKGAPFNFVSLIRVLIAVRLWGPLCTSYGH